MKIDSEHLEILSVIVEKGGLTEGAEALGKSQPSVSRTISLLEKRLGLPLFEHGRRPLRPTEFGLTLANIGRSIHALNQEARTIVRRFQTGQSGHLKLGGTPLFMDGVLASMLADFQEQVGSLHIEQAYGYFDSLVSKLRNGTIEIAVLPLHEKLIPHDMDFLPILEGRNVIACREGHPLTRKKTITIGDVGTYSWIAPPADSPLFRDLRRVVTSIGIENAQFTYSGGTLASIASFLSRSESLTVLPNSVLFLARKTHGLAALPLKIDHPDRQLGMLTLKERRLTPVVPPFMKFIETQCAQLEARMRHEQQVTKRRG